MLWRLKIIYGWNKFLVGVHTFLSIRVIELFITYTMKVSSCTRKFIWKSI
jgi:hypothetical protein